MSRITARRWCTGIVVLALIASASVAIPAIAQIPLTVRIDRVDFAAFPEVAVEVSVRDANGVPVRDLGPGDFDVSEDRTLKSRPVTKVEPGVNPNQPIGVILALDTSGSMRGRAIAEAKAAAVRFLDRLGLGDRAALLAFSDAVSLEEPFPQLDPNREQDFTAEKDPLLRLIDGLEAAGNTSLYDAAYKAVRLAARQPAGNRAVLLLTDGRDEVAGGPRGSGSRVANEDSPIREANRSNVPIFAVGLGDQIDAPYLKRLAMETGGTYQETPDSAELGRLFQNVADLLKQQYRVVYGSAVERDGQRHQTLVSVKARGTVAFDEAGWGPLPATPRAAVVPTVAATASPAAMASPAATTVVAPTPTPRPQDGQNGGLNTWVVAGGGGTAVLALVGLAALARSRRPAAPVARCLRCGHALPGPGARCPSCGEVGG